MANSQVPNGVVRQVIVVTDGDELARRALQMAAKQLHARLISRTAGNPTRLTGEQIVTYIKQARYDPVIVMLDDNGNGHQGHGENALWTLAHHPDIKVIGALAVASNTSYVKGVDVDFSIDCNGRRVESGVDKDGIAISKHKVYGDTVDILRRLQIPVIVGVGDIGKMSGRDAPERAAPVTTQALRELVAAYRQNSGHKAHSHG